MYFIKAFYDGSNTDLDESIGQICEVENTLGLKHADIWESRGWILCDGKDYSPTGKLEPLFKTIKYTYGKVSYGWGTKEVYFKVPDYRGRPVFSAVIEPACECGKDKHGFACHLTFCPKWSKS